MPLRRDPLEDLVHVHLGATGQRVVNILPIQEKDFHERTSRGFLPITPMEIPV